MRPFGIGLLLIAVVFGPLAAQERRGEPERRSVPANGFEIFRGLFAYHKVTPVERDELNAQQVDYSKTIVVVLGIPRFQQGWFDIGDQTRRTLQAGGSVLIAVNRSSELGFLFPARSGTRMVTTDDVLLCDNAERIYNGDKSRPFVEPKAAGLFGSTNDMKALFAGRSRIATNRPRAIFVGDSSKYVSDSLAGYPSGTLDGNGEKLPRDYSFAVGNFDDGHFPYRSLVLGDQDVFSNRLIAASDTDNLLFANDVVQWLTGPKKDRLHCIFYENGDLKTDFPDLLQSAEVKPPIPPVPPLPSPLDPEFQRRLADLGERALDRADRRTDFDQAFGGKGTNDRRYSKTLQTLAIIVASLLALGLVFRWWRSKHTPDLQNPPKDTGRVAASGPPGSLARRREEILQSGNYTELVREYLRELFVSRGLTLDANESPPRSLPKVETTGRGGKAIRADLRILWEVAFAENPKPITYSRWKELEPMVDAVRTAADEGRWRFLGGRA